MDTCMSGTLEHSTAALGASAATALAAKAWLPRISATFLARATPQNSVVAPTSTAFG
jgi:hypothetical protein